jgi:hypothetical protein
LQCDEDQIHGVRDLASLVAICIETKVNGPAKDLAREPIREPVAKRFAFVPRLLR